MTGIQWTEEVWNPTTGCDRVSDGCDHCYALTMAKRLKGMGQAKYQRDGDPRTSGHGFGLSVHPDALTVPLRWRKPRKIFVNSMSDLFHDEVPTEFIAQVFAAMAACPQHTFQVLTKRHGRMRALLRGKRFVQDVNCAYVTLPSDRSAIGISWPLPNVWIGVSVESQQWADIRIPALIQTPAAVRFLSCEPLLGPVDLHGPSDEHGHRPKLNYWLPPGRPYFPPGEPGSMLSGPIATAPALDWVIAGGESGPGARTCELGWLRSLRDQCAEADVPFFCKQVGSVTGREIGAGAHGADWDAWPADLRVREFPHAVEMAA